jgi:hypothetical protein
LQLKPTQNKIILNEYVPKILRKNPHAHKNTCTQKLIQLNLKKIKTYFFSKLILHDLASYSMDELCMALTDDEHEVKKKCVLVARACKKTGKDKRVLLSG